MSYFEQALNSTKYAIHKLTYNPDAEKYAKQQQLDSEKKKKQTEDEIRKAELNARKSELDKKVSTERAEKERIVAERAEFSGSRLFIRIVKTVLTMIFIALLIGGGLYGASLATNLNVYKSAPFRILYAIWGFIFFWVVIPYVWIYRWFWLGKSPEYYSFLPIIPYKFNHWFMHTFFRWMTYIPLDVGELKEWQE
jgi:hypothetical protein